MGVWIETRHVEGSRRGYRVTPFVGVWIETFGQCQKNGGLGVTPFVGVWIETVSEVVIDQSEMGHTLRGCVD